MTFEVSSAGVGLTPAAAPPSESVIPASGSPVQAVRPESTLLPAFGTPESVPLTKNATVPDSPPAHRSGVPKAVTQYADAGKASARGCSAVAIGVSLVSYAALLPLFTNCSNA